MNTYNSCQLIFFLKKPVFLIVVVFVFMQERRNCLQYLNQPKIDGVRVSAAVLHFTCVDFGNCKCCHHEDILGRDCYIDLELLGH